MTKFHNFGSEGLCPHCTHYHNCPGSTKGAASATVECPGELYFPYEEEHGRSERWPPEPWIFKESRRKY